VIDRQAPAQAATGAALGVLMGGISTKRKGNNLRMRLTSIQRYNAWVPALEAMTGRSIPFNRQGILRLCFTGETLEDWRSLVALRQEQGWRLDLCDRAQLAVDYPQLCLDQVIGAIYSPDDRQVDPTALTLALVDAAKQNGVTFHFDTPVLAVAWAGEQGTVNTPKGEIAADWCVLAAGLGSTPLTAALQQPVEIRPVLGQAMQVQLPQPLGHDHLQPVITGNDVHLVPLGQGNYWIGATVEFPSGASEPIADPATLEQVMQQAIALCPGLKDAIVVRRWIGLRPRPEGRPAPIIEPLPGYPQLLLATGHYRNGILLAPATAMAVRQWIRPEA